MSNGNRPAFPEFAARPTQGPAIFHRSALQVVFSCACHPEAPVLMIHGTHEGAVCPLCAREFIISQVHFDRSKSDHRTDVQLGVKEPSIIRPTG